MGPREILPAMNAVPTPYLVRIPGLTLMPVVLTAKWLGDWLRDWLDVKEPNRMG